MKRKEKRRFCALLLAFVLLACMLAGCGSSAADSRQIVRIGHNQSTNHPTHIALLAFEASLGTNTMWRFSPVSCWAPRTKWYS